MSQVIAAIWAAVTTGVVLSANLYVMWLCREASRQGRAVQAKFGMLPSVKIEGSHGRHRRYLNGRISTTPDLSVTTNATHREKKEETK